MGEATAAAAALRFWHVYTMFGVSAVCDLLSNEYICVIICLAGAARWQCHTSVRLFGSDGEWLVGWFASDSSVLRKHVRMNVAKKMEFRVTCSQNGNMGYKSVYIASAC